MSESPEENPRDNPYASPTSEVRRLTPLSDAGASVELLKTFHQQMRALGALWIIFGGLALFVSEVLLRLSDSQIDMLSGLGESGPSIVGRAVSVIGGTWLIAGLGTWLKQTWAVYIGLALSYLAGLNSLISLNLIGGVLLVLAIIQGHRVLRFAGQLRRAGVPLTTKPGELQA